MVYISGNGAVGTGLRDVKNTFIQFVQRKVFERVQKSHLPADCPGTSCGQITESAPLPMPVDLQSSNGWVHGRVHQPVSHHPQTGQRWVMVPAGEAAAGTRGRQNCSETFCSAS